MVIREGGSRGALRAGGLRPPRPATRLSREGFAARRRRSHRRTIRSASTSRAAASPSAAARRCGSSRAPSTKNAQGQLELPTGLPLLRDRAPARVRALKLDASDGEEGRRIAFEGDVELTQEGTTLRAQRLEAVYPPGARPARPADRGRRGARLREGDPRGELRARRVSAPREPRALRGRRRARRRGPARGRPDRLRARRGEARRARSHAPRRSGRASPGARPRDACSPDSSSPSATASGRWCTRVDIEVHPAQVVGLLGPNGAGKTTTFNMMAGGIRPSEGRVLLGEREITELPMYRRARLGITYLPQEPSIFRKLSVADNVNAILETVEPDRDACGASACASYWPSWGWPKRPAGAATRSPAASGGGSRSRARSCWIRSSCCSTSRSRASIRSR